MSSYNEMYLAHYGTMGMKWGIRKYQNPDGSLTEAGRARYGRKVDKYRQKLTNKYTKQINKASARGNQALERSYRNKLENVNKMTDSDILYERKKKKGAAVLGASLGAVVNIVRKTPNILKQASRIESKYGSMYVDDVMIKDSRTNKAKALALISMYSVAGLEGAAVGGAGGAFIGGSYMESARNKHFNKNKGGKN